MSDKNKQNDDLIAQLTEGLEPCEPLAHPLKRMLPWLIIAPLYILIVAVFFIGVRPDWYEMLMHEPKYQIDLGLALFVAISSGIVLGWVNLPDMRQQEWVINIPIAALLLFLGNVIYSFVTADFSNPEYDMMCFPHSVVFMVVPLGYLIFLMRKGCPACHKKSALFATLSVAAFGWIGLRLTSPIDHIAQNFVIQFLPWVLLGVLIGILSDKLFRW